MVMNMGRAGHRVDIESGVQASSTLILTRSVNGIALGPRPAFQRLQASDRGVAHPRPQPPALLQKTGRPLYFVG
jgi:hypothetical protein